MAEAQQAPPKEASPISVRLPRDVQEALRRLATEDARSLNGEILWILRQYVEQRAKQGKG